MQEAMQPCNDCNVIGLRWHHGHQSRLQLVGSAWKKAASFEERTQGEDVQGLGSDDITDKFDELG